jgi:A/G-specific adenine glycosylase
MSFSDEITRWYLKNKRKLPWRETTDAYVIWLSEIILQQTRVEQGMPYFHRFLEKYPDVVSFAAATEDEILHLWQGLGYYSRGRNMLKTARQVAEYHSGVFPVQYEQLIQLKGIGEYTAAAIASFAANEAKAVVDGNVFRVLARYFGIGEPVNSTKGKKIFQDIADEILNRDHPGLHNQAVMEFGAMLCKPKSPDCPNCPVRENCYAYNHNQVRLLPKKNKTVKVRDRYFNYLLITDGDKVLMKKRDESDIWANMYDLPLIETPSYTAPQNVTELLQTKELLGGEPRIIAFYSEKRHLLTHQRIHAQFIHVENQPIKLEQKYFFIEVKNIKMLALPKILNIFLTKFFN